MASLSIVRNELHWGCENGHRRNISPVVDDTTPIHNEDHNADNNEEDEAFPNDKTHYEVIQDESVAQPLEVP